MITKTSIRRAVTLITVVVFSLAASLPVHAQPGNDQFADARVISSLPFNLQVDNTNASIEAGEPVPSCAWYYNPGHTVWFSYTPSEDKTITAFVDNASVSTAIAVYTGDSISGLTELNCRTWDRLTIRVYAGTTYYYQVSSLWAYEGQFRFNLDFTPPPQACFYWSPGDPSRFDTIFFGNCSYDPGQLGFVTSDWDFGDGTKLTVEDTGYVYHQFASDGEYTVTLKVTTVDGRTGSVTSNVNVSTHDVSITKFNVPKTASFGQTRTITVGLTSKYYPEMVRVILYKSVPGSWGGFTEIGRQSILVPIRSANRTTDVNFSYTFTHEDAYVGKVTFKAEVTPDYWRDVFIADNQMIATTKVSSGGAR